MTAPVETVRDPLNILKWVIAIVLLASATLVTRMLPDLAQAWRLLLMIGLALVALVVLMTTRQGRQFADLLQHSKVELKKVTWPTRPETTQTTLIVMVVVVIMSLVLWGMDSLFGFLISAVIG